MRRDFDVRAQARATLDRAKKGEPVSIPQITQALIDGGDLAPEAVVQIRRRSWEWKRIASEFLAPASWLDPLN